MSAEKDSPELEGLDLFYRRWSKGIVTDEEIVKKVGKQWLELLQDQKDLDATDQEDTCWLQSWAGIFRGCKLSELSIPSATSEQESGVFADGGLGASDDARSHETDEADLSNSMGSRGTKRPHQ